jgi:tRNA1Val (adenine37-N6)-methyltransferase
MSIASGQKKPCANEAETLDTIYNGKIKLFQKKNGYRFSIDAVLLADFLLNVKGGNIIDIGTGCGVVPLMIVSRKEHCKITGIEIQDSLFDLAKRNVKENGFIDRIDIIKHDIRDIKSIFKPGSFDIVTANPPYIKHDAGRINPQEEKAIARHEITISLEDLIKTSKYLLTSTGKVVIIYPANRTIDLIELLRKESVEPKRIQMIHSKYKGEAKLVIVEASKSAKKGGLKILSPRIIYNDDSTYTDEVERILQGA